MRGKQRQLRCNCLRLLLDADCSHTAVETLVVNDLQRGSGFIGASDCTPSIASITSIASIAAAIADQQPEADLHLYWGAAEAQELFLLDDIAAALPLNGQLVLCAEDGDPASGIIRPGSPLDAIKADFDTLDGWQAYAAGPPRMVEAAAPLLHSLGLTADAFRADAFFTEQDKQKSPS